MGNVEYSPCPVCKNKDLKLGECIYDNKIVAYNVYCPNCNFTSRSYKMRYKAINKWNSLCRQSRGIKIEN